MSALITTVAIENTAEAPCVLCVDEMGIFHVKTPSIHLGEAHSKDRACNSPRMVRTADALTCKNAEPRSLNASEVTGCRR